MVLSVLIFKNLIEKYLLVYLLHISTNYFHQTIKFQKVINKFCRKVNINN